MEREEQHNKQQKHEKIIIFDVAARASSESSNEDAIVKRGWVKDKIKELVVAKPSEIAADELDWNMKQFLNNIHKT